MQLNLGFWVMNRCLLTTSCSMVMWPPRDCCFLWSLILYFDWLISFQHILHSCVLLWTHYADTWSNKPNDWLRTVELLKNYALYFTSWPHYDPGWMKSFLIIQWSVANIPFLILILGFLLILKIDIYRINFVDIWMMENICLSWSCSIWHTMFSFHCLV